MAIVDDILKSNVLTGLAIGIGAAILTPIILPIVASIAKPLTKSAIKGGIILYEKSRETIAELGETVEDLVAEVKAELAQEHAPPAGAAAVAKTTEESVVEAKTQANPSA
jgi:hypothetical protein